MKRRTRNDKVLRAITIGLATMIAATSAPVNVWADDDNTNNESNDSNDPDDSKDNDNDGSEEASEPTVVDTDIEICEEAQEIISGNETNETNETNENTQPGEGTVIIGDGNGSVNEENPTSPVSIYEYVQTATEAVAAADGLGTVALDPDVTASWTVAPGTSEVTTVAGALAAAYTAPPTDAPEGTPGTGFVVEAENDINNAKEALGTIQGAEQQTKKAEKALKTAEKKLETFTSTADDNDDDIELETGDAITQASIANDEKTSKDDALAAAGKAANSLAESKEKLGEVTEAYTKASDAVTQAKTEYNAAVQAQKDAQDELDKVNDLIKSAKTNATAAQERLKAAQAKVERCAKEVEKNSENLESIKNVEKQYYALMVQYFREMISDPDNNLEITDGKVDMAKNAAKITSKDNINNKAESPGNSVLVLARNLMAQIITTKFAGEGCTVVSIGEAVDDEANGVKKDDFDTKASTMQKGEVFTNNNGKPQTKLLNNTKTDTDNKKEIYKISSKANEAANVYRKDGKDNGRTNRFAVQYKKPGEETVTTAYFNVVYKNSKYGDKTDIENGFIFVAEITKNEKGKFVTERIDGGLDDYSELVKIISAAQDMEDYQKALAAVNAASERVTELQEKIDELKEISADGNAIEELKKRLDKANDDLEKATEEKEYLEDLVDKAQKAVDGIDLSRFNDEEGEEGEKQVTPTPTPDPTTPADTDTTDTTGTTDSTGTTDDSDTTDDGTTTTTGADTFVVDGIPTYDMGATGGDVLPAYDFDEVGDTTGGTGGGAGGGAGAGGATSGVLGVRNPAAQAVASLNQVKLPAGNNKVVVDNTQQKGTKVGDPITPLAATPFEEGAHISWLWLLIILLLGATGKKMYDEHKKRVEAREQAKNLDD